MPDDMADLSGGGRLPMVPPPPPDETERRKQEQLAAIHPHRVQRILEVGGAGVDPGTLSRQFGLPVSLIMMILSNPKAVHEAQNSPMNLGRGGASSPPGVQPVDTHRPGVSPNRPPP